MSGPGVRIWHACAPNKSPAHRGRFTYDPPALVDQLAIWARFDMVGVITNERHTHVMNSAPGLGDLVCPAGNDCDESHLVGALK